MPTSRQRFPAFDGFRGIAVLLVLLRHAGVLDFGWIGVDAFFVLSGFLITGILLDAIDAGGCGLRTYGFPFYVRRILRIFPLAYVALFIVLLVFPALGLLPHVRASDQLWYWGYLSNWTLPRSRTTWQLDHFWSLAVEEQFYLCWPWVVISLNRRNLERVCITLLMVAPVLRILLLAKRGDLYEVWTPLRMDGLLAGALLASYTGSGDVARLKEVGTWMVGLGAAGFVAVEMKSSHAAYVFASCALASAFTGVITIIIAAPSGLLARTLSLRLIRWVGTISYGAYVIHFPIAFWLRRNLKPEWLVVTGTIAGTLILATISWHFLEKPFIQLKRHWNMPDSRNVSPGGPSSFVRLETGAAT